MVSVVCKAIWWFATILGMCLLLASEDPVAQISGLGLVIFGILCHEPEEF